MSSLTTSFEGKHSLKVKCFWDNTDGGTQIIFGRYVMPRFSYVGPHELIFIYIFIYLIF